MTAAIIARDEERHLAGCLASLAWADSRLVVVDDRTRDRSADVARVSGATVAERPFRSFPIQRNSTLALASDTLGASWVLFVDADERVPPMLASEVRQSIARAETDAPVGYWIPRRNFIWGGWIRHGGWSPDHQLRLLKVGAAHYDERRDVHELANLAGPPGYLHEPLIHYNYDRLDQFLIKQRNYVGLEATRLVREGYVARPRSFVLQPLREFRRRYVELQGFRDGWRGFVLAVLLAWYTGQTYAEMARLGWRSRDEGVR